MPLYLRNFPDHALVNRRKNLVMTRHCQNSDIYPDQVIGASSNLPDWQCSAAKSDRCGGHKCRNSILNSFK